jgi:hypothetical protein
MQLVKLIYLYDALANIIVNSRDDVASFVS